MQVGDMVQLSSAGRKSQQNYLVTDKIGLVIKIDRSEYPYHVQWYGGDGKLPNHHGNHGVLPCKRYELKKLRVKK